MIKLSLYPISTTWYVLDYIYDTGYETGIRDNGSMYYVHTVTYSSVGSIQL